jgi:hypothetical protein
MPERARVSSGHFSLGAIPPITCGVAIDWRMQPLSAQWPVSRGRLALARSIAHAMLTVRRTALGVKRRARYTQHFFQPQDRGRP